MSTSSVISAPFQTIAVKVKTLVERALEQTYVCLMEYCHKEMTAHEALVPGLKTMYAFIRNTPVDANHPLTVSEMSTQTVCAKCAKTPEYTYPNVGPLMNMVLKMQQATEENVARLVGTPAVPVAPLRLVTTKPMHKKDNHQSKAKSTKLVTPAIQHALTLSLTCKGCNKPVTAQSARLTGLESLYAQLRPQEMESSPLCDTPLRDTELAHLVWCQECAPQSATFRFLGTVALMERWTATNWVWRGKKPVNTTQDAPRKLKPGQLPKGTTPKPPKEKSKGPAQVPWTEKTYGEYKPRPVVKKKEDDGKKRKKKGR